jgi:hypothetical protein
MLAPIAAAPARDVSEAPPAPVPSTSPLPSAVITIPADAVAAPPSKLDTVVVRSAPVVPSVDVTIEPGLPSEAGPPSVPDLSSSPLAAPDAPLVEAASADANGASPAAAPAAFAGFEVIRAREEAPTADNPIAYRELALATEPGLGREAAELMVLTALDEARRALPTAGGRYVQIALFDHKFDKRPARAPLVTLSWKDWKGEPVLEFPGFADHVAETRAPLVPTPSTRPPGWEVPTGGSVAPAPILAVGVSTAASAQSIAPAPMIPVAAAVPSEALAPDSVPIALVNATDVRPAFEAPAPLTPRLVDYAAVADLFDSDPPAAPLEPVTEAPAMDRTTPLLEPPPAVELPRAVQLAPAVAPATVVERPPELEPPAPMSISEIPASSFGTRRHPEEDLIGELFERLHELHFMPDLVSGATFVLRTLRDLLPCEGTVIHVFDIDRSEFAVVRAYGPNAAETLLFRTPGSDALMSDVMRHNGAICIDDATGDPRFANGALSRLGVTPKSVLCGAARQGGRYLGMIELANPVGDTPFHENEQSALEYLCAQFAELVANRPVVLDPEMVL